MLRPQEISRIHLLIHPGYIQRVQTDQRNVMEASVSPEELRHLADLYIEKARTLGTDELMVLFAPTNDFPKEMREQKWLYTKVITAVEQILKRRLIVLVDDPADSDKSSVYRRNAAQAWSRIEKIVHARGYILSPSVTADAYGEALDSCVEDIATHLHEAAGLQEPVTLNAELSDYVIAEEAYHKSYKPLDERRRIKGDEFHVNPRAQVKFR